MPVLTAQGRQRWGGLYTEHEAQDRGLQLTVRDLYGGVL